MKQLALLLLALLFIFPLSVASATSAEDSWDVEKPKAEKAEGRRPLPPEVRKKVGEMLKEGASGEDIKAYLDKCHEEHKAKRKEHEESEGEKADRPKRPEGDDNADRPERPEDGKRHEEARAKTRATIEKMKKKGASKEEVKAYLDKCREEHEAKRDDDRKKTDLDIKAERKTIAKTTSQMRKDGKSAKEISAYRKEAWANLKAAVKADHAEKVKADKARKELISKTRKTIGEMKKKGASNEEINAYLEKTREENSALFPKRPERKEGETGDRKRPDPKEDKGDRPEPKKEDGERPERPERGRGRPQPPRGGGPRR
jgi:DNA-binding transcriptional regulator YhcF (GntR family)